MSDWIILLLLVALGLGGYWLMGRVGDFLAGNLVRNALKASPVLGWTPQVLRFILGRSAQKKTVKKEGKVHGCDASAPRSAGTPHGCAG